MAAHTYKAVPRAGGTTFCSLESKDYSRIQENDPLGNESDLYISSVKIIAKTNSRMGELLRSSSSSILTYMHR